MIEGDGPPRAPTLAAQSGEPLSNTEDERRKARLETQVVEGFLPIYNKMTGRALRIERLGQPPEPDVLCRDERTGEENGVEVVSAYYDKDHARAEWEKARGRDTAGYQLTLPDREENIRVLAWVAPQYPAKGKEQVSRLRSVVAGGAYVLLAPISLPRGETGYETPHSEQTSIR